MNTTDTNDTPKRRLADHQPATTIDWAAPGAPAVPAAPDTPRVAPLRAVASMSVSADGISFFATPAAYRLEHGHYMLPAPGAEFRPPVKDLPARLQRDHERGILHPHHAYQCDFCQAAGARPPQAATTLTNEQITAGAAVIGDDGKPVGRNTAIMVWDAMGASPVAPEQDQAIAEVGYRLCDEGSFKKVATARGFSDFSLTISGKYHDPALETLHVQYESEQRGSTDSTTPAAHIAPAEALSVDDERAAFEAEERKHSSNLNRQPSDGQYENPCTQSAWEGWQARAAHIASKPNAEPVAYVNGDELDNMLDDRTATIQSSRTGYRATPLYATPAASAPTVPEGWKLTPVILTDEMRRAAYHKIGFTQMYEAAIASAPAAPSASADAVIEAKAEPEECWSLDEEDFNHQSLGDLIGTHEDLKPGDTVWVGEAVHPDAAQMVNVDSILENIGEAAYDIGGEHAEDYPDVTNEQSKELERLVADWLNRSCKTTFWTVTNIKPYRLSADDFPNDSTPIHAEFDTQATKGE